MKAVFSYWSKSDFSESYLKPTGNIPFRYKLYNFALSVLLADEHFNKVELHTDDNGIKLFDQLHLPFNNVYLSLNSIKDHNALNWTFGKMFTYSLQESPFIHLDFDVFLFKPLPESLLNSDIFCQSLEKFSNSYFYTRGDYDIEKLPYYPWIDKRPLDQRIASNVGIIGGHNVNFIREYALQAMSLTTHPLNIVCHHIPSKVSWDRITVYQEQYLLNLFAYNKGIEITYLLPYDTLDTDAPKWIEEQENYCHLMGNKYSTTYSTMMRDYLEENYNEYFERIQNLDLLNWKNTFS